MVKFNIICDVKIKWWVQPMITLLKAYALVTRNTPDVDKLADFIARRGIKKKFTINTS